MNWSFILIQMVVFFGLSSFMIAAIYYLRHRHSKALSIKAQMEQKDSEDGGEFLKRYIPPEHRTRPDKSRNTSLFASRPLFYAACTLIPVLFLSFTGFSYYSNRSSFIAEVTLDPIELSNMIVRNYTFKDTIGSYAPSLKKVAEAVDAKKIFVIFKHRKNPNEIADEWTNYLTALHIKNRTCYYETFERCKLHSNVTAIIALENTTPVLLDRLFRMKTNIVATGFPDNPTQHATLLPGITFKDNKGTTSTNMAIVGDSVLTLGIDAGLNFALPSNNQKISAHSATPQAISMFSDGNAGGSTDTRMHAGVHEDSRIIWMDFTPSDALYIQDSQRSQIDAVLAGILRYATEQEYSSIASWPEGRKYAAFMEQDTEDQFEESIRVADFFRENHYPITWYALSDLAQVHRGVAETISDAGEIACHGDNHDIVTRYDTAEQLEKLTRCIKVMEAVTGQTPTGFRPPTEAHNNDTFSALISAGMTHIFAEHHTRTLVPHLKLAEGTERSLVSLTRAITDDYYLWDTLHLDKQQSLDRMTGEQHWIESVGGLFGFSFHSQFMSKDDYFGVVTTLAHSLGNDKHVWMDTAGNIAQWWSTRHDLLLGEQISAELIEKFKPVKLFVDASGTLQSHLLTPGDDYSAGLSVAQQE